MIDVTHAHVGDRIRMRTAEDERRSDRDLVRFAAGDVAIVFALAGVNASDEALLDDDERARAARFVSAIDRRRFVAAHALLRHVLGTELGCDPATIRFARDAHGKPRLADRAPDLRFNLAHAGDGAIVAFAYGRDVGVDLERVDRRVDVERLARRAFVPAERAALATFPPEERHAAFLRGWCRKEALCKATGVGLARGLARFTVSLAREPEEAMLADAARPLGESWTLRTFAPAPDFLACVAARAERAGP